MGTALRRSAATAAPQTLIDSQGVIVAAGTPRALIERWSTREVVELRFADGVIAGPAADSTGAGLRRTER